jgi:hypothetical protein
MDSNAQSESPDEWDDWEAEADAGGFSVPLMAEKSWNPASKVVAVTKVSEEEEKEEEDPQKPKKKSKQQNVADFILMYYHDAMMDHIKPARIKARGSIAIQMNKDCYTSKITNIGEIMSRIHTVITQGKISVIEQRNLSDLTNERDKADGIVKSAKSQIMQLNGKLELMKQANATDEQFSMEAQKEVSDKIDLLLILMQKKHGDIQQLEKEIMEKQQRIDDKKGGRNSSINQRYINARKYMHDGGGSNTFKVIQILTKALYPESVKAEVRPREQRRDDGFKRRESRDGPPPSRSDGDTQWRRGSAPRGGDRQPRYDGQRRDEPRYDGQRRDEPRYDGPRYDGPRYDDSRSDSSRWERGAPTERGESSRPRRTVRTEEFNGGDGGSGKVYEERFERQTPRKKSAPSDTGKNVYVPPSRRKDDSKSGDTTGRWR